MNPEQEKPGKVDGDNGFITWQLGLKPGEEKVITIKYVITHPKGTSLEDTAGNRGY